MELNNFQILSLAGLLHDVGKIRQRAGEKIINDYNLSYCPEYKHYTSHIHAAHTAEFLDKFVSNFNIKSKNNLINIASYHHKKDTDDPFVEIVKKADSLSSGFEREDSDESGKYKEDRLESVFSQIWLNKKPKTYFYPIKRLDFDIVPEPEEKETNQDSYKKLYEDFMNDLERINKNTSFDIFWDALIYIYENYAWAVPSSSYYSHPRISLFDHSKTTAAIAQALYGYHKDDLSVAKIQNCKESEFIIAQGDFAGIQNFIFSKMGDSNRYAAKILRAKSFYVSLATDLVAFDICRKLGLTKAAVIMNAGGKFTLLLPNTQETIDAVDKSEKEINDYFTKLTFGETRFSIAYVEASREDFSIKDGRFSKKMGEAANKLEAKKLKPTFEKYIFEDYLGRVKDNGICKICGKHPALNNEDGICEYCNVFKKIGTKIVNSSNFVITDNDCEKCFNIDDRYFLFFNSKNINKAVLAYDLKNDSHFNGIAKSKISGYVPKISEEEIEIEKYDKEEEDFKENDPKTFSMIAHDAKVSNEDGEYVGESFLGILKADVDNLGRFFIEGFHESESISKIVSLSRMVDFFFIGWLQNILKEKYSSVYTVFAGGDDLFLIGPFDKIIDLAGEMNRHLKEYVKNEDFHLSCGIYFVKPKIPVYQVTEQTESILEDAKHQGKNRIGVFGRVVLWDRFEEMMEDENAVNYLNKLSGTFRYSLYQFINSVEVLKNKKMSKSTRDLMWKPLFLYQSYRNVDKDIRADFIEDFIGYFEKYGGDFTVPLSNFIYRNRRRRNG